MTGSVGGRGNRRVLLIGLDSADADLIEAWMAAGYMPNFAKLRGDGLWGRLGTTAEIMHVSAWPTLYTGTTPGHHGMYHAYQVRAGNQFIQRTEPDWCGQAPFWKHLDDAGRKCVIFDAFMDYQLPGFGGVQILEYGTWTWFGKPASTPRGMLRHIKQRFGPYPAPEHANLVQVPTDPAGFRDQLVAGTRLKSRITRSLMKEQSWDLMFVSFGEPHGAGHYLWHFGDPQYPLHSPAAPPTAGNYVRDVYSAVDSAIGDIIDGADDQTTVIVTSADGMGPNYSGCHLLPELLHRMGLFHSGNVGGGNEVAKAPKKGLLQAVRQAIPLGLRQSVTRCMPRRMRYQLEMKWVNSSIHWHKSKVFCIPNSNEGYFRVNLMGREPQGIVRSDGEYEQVLGSLKDELEKLVNPRNAIRAAERVSLIDDVYIGARRPDLPDAVISWNLDAQVLNELESPASGRIVKQPGYAVSPFYTGNHRPTAFVLARGPSVPAAETLRGGHILDLAPTVLATLGVDQPAQFEGCAWGALC